MSLSKEEVEKIASLARIELTRDEVEKFQNQLSDILLYIEKLQEVDTDNIAPTAQVTGLENVWREDEIVELSEEDKKAIIDQAPNKVANLVKVKSVF